MLFKTKKIVEPPSDQILYLLLVWVKLKKKIGLKYNQENIIFVALIYIPVNIVI